MIYSDTDRKYKRYNVTTALPYANGPVHIGHVAGVYLPADIYVRYLRMQGEDVLFVGGSDEHGVPITIKARKEGVTPQDIVDKYHGIIKQAFAEFGISFDVYSRTSSALHHKVAAKYFKDLYDKGCFVEKQSEQYFDPEAQTFLADRYIVGTCPYCHNDHAYGDQCEACGTSLNATDLINPHSTLSGATPIKKETTHWYLPLDHYDGFFKEWILKNHKHDWRTTVYGQCKSWIDQGLQPRAVTRDLNWGVEVPLPDAKGKVLYVWFDAPIGYISNTMELLPDTWETYWKDETTKLVHFIGKDNIVFHCLIFPAMLKAHGDFILPANVPANEFLNLEGDKISTSRNWAVWLHEYLIDFPQKQDVLRYVLCSNAPETKDNDFTWKDFQTKNNSELVAIFGNFVNRTLVLIQKYFNGYVPPKGAYSESEKQLQEAMLRYPESIGRKIENYHFRDALTELMNLARMGNKYLTDHEPWKLAKTNLPATATVLNTALQLCGQLALLCEPFLPFTAAKLKNMLNLPERLTWTTSVVELLPEGKKLAETELLFDKIEDSTIENQIKKLLETKKQNQIPVCLPPAKETVAYEDFMKMDIRSATILEAERVPKTKKLLKLVVDTGIDKRTVVSGIAEYYTPQEIIGKQVCLLVNLAPRNLKGIESQGMVLMAEDADGKLHFVVPTEKINNGAGIQ